MANDLNDNNVTKPTTKCIKNEFEFDLEELYPLAVQFYKDKEGKAMHIPYKDKLELVALTQQVAHGKFVPDGLPPVGYLDVIGKDRRQAWLNLADMPKEEAMDKFIWSLNDLCPLFKPFVEAHKRDLEEKQKILEIEEANRRLKEEEEKKLLEEAKLREEANLMKQEKQKQQIKDALNKQTFSQFKSYAEKQYPGNPEQQAVLIRQLQEQHYQQYMQQLYQQQIAQQQNHQLDLQPESKSDTVNSSPQFIKGDDPSSGDSESDDSLDSPPIEPASMWTQKSIKEFKEEILREGGNGVIKVGHGETVTVSVPTREDGTSLFWEFATDSYDIGFGVYFEWNSAPGQNISVLISENEDEDEEAEEEEHEDDPESMRAQKPNRPPISVIIPVYRRDCHEEVYMGTHRYPAPGVYLLKFDNSYSLWRSKTLYYRVCYSR